MENNKDYINTKLTLKSMNDQNLNQSNKTVNNPFVNILLSGILVVMILVVMSQSFQISKLQGYAEALLKTPAAKAASGSPQAAAQISTRPAASGLPSQVGGC